MSEQNQKILLEWRHEDWLATACFLILAFLFTLSLWLGGEWWVSHEYFHAVTRLSAFSEALGEGQFPPRWAGDMTAGYGYPFFLFFPPLSFFPATLFHWAGLSLAEAWKVELLLVRFLGITGMYCFLRTRTNRLAAFAGALFFASVHYHAITLIIRGNLQEFIALNLWTWAFLGAEVSARSMRWRSPLPALASLPIAAVAVTHVLTSYMLAIAISLWSIFLIFEGWVAFGPASGLKRFGKLAITGALSAGLSAFFFLPAMMEVSLVQSDTLKTIQLQDHFLYAIQFFTPLWEYGLSLPGPDDTMSFALGWGLIAGILSLIASLVIRRGRAPAGIWVLTALFLLTCFAMHHCSAPLWPLAPGSSFLQFPWRAMIPAVFFGSGAAGWGVAALLETVNWEKTAGKLLMAGVLVIPPACVAPFLQPSQYWPELPEVKKDWFRHRLGNTTLNEYLPRTVPQLPRRVSMDRLIWRQGSGRSELIERTGVYRRYEVESFRQSAVSAEVFYYPGWVVEIEGVQTAAWPEEELGLLTWSQPPGRSEVVLRFQNTPIRSAANAITLAALAVLAVWLFLARKELRGLIRPSAGVPEPLQREAHPIEG